MAETLEDITAEASITKTGEGTEKLEKVTGENGEVSYQLTATPGTGQKLKGITVNGTEAKVGGIVGCNNGNIQKCYNSTEITSTGAHIGGITGINGNEEKSK